MTDNPTPEAVKAARERVTQYMMKGLSGQPIFMHMGTSHLVSELDAIARDWLRLKEVEKAGRVLAGQFDAALDELDECSITLSRESYNCPAHNLALAAFRAAVEGK